MQSRGPNTLNINLYTQNLSSQDRVQYSGDSNQVDETAIQQQFDNFVREIQQYDEILSKVAKNVEEASHDKLFITDFYPEPALQIRYDNDEEKKIVSSTNEEMGKIISSLEKNNSILKHQLRGWHFQFAKKTRLTQVLISQNKLLRKCVSSKNKQIVKLIQSITRANNEELNELKCTLQQLKQENGILADHLQQIKKVIEEKKNHQKKLAIAIVENNQKKIMIQAKAQECQDKQEHSAKAATLLQECQKQAQHRQKYLQSERKRLINLKQQFIEDSSAIDSELNRCNIDRKDLDDLFQGKHKGKIIEKQTSLQQIQEESENFQRLMQINKNYQQQIRRNKSRLQQYQRINTDLDKKLNENKLILEKKQNQMNETIQKQISTLSEVDLMDYEIKKIKKTLQNKHIQNEEYKQRINKSLKIFADQRNDQINKWRSQLGKSKKQVNLRQLQQRSEIQMKQKQIGNLEHQIKSRNQEINTLISEINQRKQREMVAAQMKQRLIGTHTWR